MVLHCESHLGCITALIELTEVNRARVHCNSVDCKYTQNSKANWNGLIRTHHFDWN